MFDYMLFTKWTRVTGWWCILTNSGRFLHLPVPVMCDAFLKYLTVRKLYVVYTSILRTGPELICSTLTYVYDRTVSRVASH